MKIVTLGNKRIEISVNNICGNVHHVTGLKPVMGYWVNITVENKNKFRESFPLLDEQSKLRIFLEYDVAIDSTVDLLLQNMSVKGKHAPSIESLTEDNG